MRRKRKTKTKAPLTQHEMAVAGGIARAKKFTKKQRVESARHAAQMRWGTREDDRAEWSA